MAESIDLAIQRFMVVSPTGRFAYGLFAYEESRFANVSYVRSSDLTI